MKTRKIAQTTCPECGHSTSKITDSRPTKFAGEMTVKRRRKCLSCEERFTTYEVSESILRTFRQRVTEENIVSILEALE